MDSVESVDNAERKNGDRMERVLAIDPGLATAGLVMWGGTKIVAVETLSTLADGPKPTFAKAVERSAYMADGVLAFCDAMRPDVVVIESYIDFGGGHGRSAANRWTTPLMIGYLIATLAGATSLPVVYQDPTVLAAYRDVAELWRVGRSGYLPGDQVLRNEHLRSAGIHLAAYLQRSRLRS